MKICIISHALHPYSEKSKKFQHSSCNDVLLNLSHGFKDLGHDVFLILPKNSDSSFPMFVADGDYQHNLAAFQPHQQNIISLSTNSCLSNMFDYAFEHQHEFDVIINLGHDWLPFFMVNKFKTLYITIPNLLYPGRPLENFIQERASQFPNNVLFISHYQNSILGSSLNKVIYLPFDLSLFLPAKKVKNNFLLWAGRITPEKGLKEALLFARQVNIPLFVAGEIQNLSYFYQLSNQFDFTYLGILDKPSLYSYMNDAIAFLQFQNSDFWLKSFGRVTAEAMLNGCPIIYVDNGANKELISIADAGLEFSVSSSPSQIISSLASIDVVSLQKKAQLSFSRELICSHFIQHFSSLLHV